MLIRDKDMQRMLNVLASESTTKTGQTYSVEYFHIYTDEEIGESHTISLGYLESLREMCGESVSSIILIDDYNPEFHKLTPAEILEFLSSQGARPDYWALEGDLVASARRLMDSINDRRLKKNYLRYVEARGKLPCSLLTATWYLTRLGVFDTSIIKSSSGEASYVPAGRLVNILPATYRGVEAKAKKIIDNSPYSTLCEDIQDVFYEVDTGRSIKLL